jgi:hypothetical protein
VHVRVFPLGFLVAATRKPSSHVLLQSSSLLSPAASGPGGQPSGPLACPPAHGAHAAQRRLPCGGGPAVAPWDKPLPAGRPPQTGRSCRRKCRGAALALAQQRCCRDLSSSLGGITSSSRPHGPMHVAQGRCMCRAVSAVPSCITACSSSLGGELCVRMRGRSGVRMPRGGLRVRRKELTPLGRIEAAFD